nr:ABC transporter permease [Candidatus Nanopelagicales bacterium]
MNDALRTEFRKITTTRTWWINALLMLGYMVVMSAIMAASFVFGMRAEPASSDPMVLDPQSIASSVYTLAVALGYIFPAVLGAMVVTSEFRHRTITMTLLAEPRRTLVLGSKLAAVLPFAVVVALAGVLGAVIGGATTLAVLGEPTFLA